MGIKCAQDVFQGQMDKTFCDIPSVFGIADDFIIAGWDQDGHEKRTYVSMMTSWWYDVRTYCSMDTSSKRTASRLIRTK